MSMSIYLQLNYKISIQVLLDECLLIPEWFCTERKMMHCFVHWLEGVSTSFQLLTIGQFDQI